MDRESGTVIAVDLPDRKCTPMCRHKNQIKTVQMAIEKGQEAITMKSMTGYVATKNQAMTDQGAATMGQEATTVKSMPR